MSTFAVGALLAEVESDPTRIFWGLTRARSRDGSK